MSKDFKKSFYNLHTRFLTFLLNRPQYICYTKSPIEQSLSMNFNTNDEEIINLDIYILQRKCTIQALKKNHVIRVKWKNGKTDMLSPNLKSNNSSWSYLYQGRYSLTGIIEWMPTTVIKNIKNIKSTYSLKIIMMYHEIRRWLRGYILGGCIPGGESMDVRSLVITGSHLGDPPGWWLKPPGKSWSWFSSANKIKHTWIHVRNLRRRICLL